MIPDSTLYLLNCLFMTKAIQEYFPISKLPVKYHTIVRIFIFISFFIVGVVGTLLASGVYIPEMLLRSYSMIIAVIGVVSCVYALATSTYNHP